MEPIFKILIVEDHVPIREYIRGILSEKFPAITIEEAGCAEEALEKVTTSKPQLILMDIGLPDKNGIELTREIKRDFPDTRIVILTGLGRSFEKAAYDNGAAGYLEKGLSGLAEIYATVESSMASFLPPTS